MKNRWLIPTATVFLIAAGIVAVSAPFPNIQQDVGVCDPNFPNRCIAPDVNGAIPITGSISATTAATATAAAPSYVEGTANALSQTLAGALRSDLTTIGTTAIATGSGVMTAGTQRVALATDSPGVITLEAGRVPENPISGQAGVAGGTGAVGANTVRIVPAQATYAVSGAAEANHVLKASAGSLVDVEVQTGASSGFVLVFDAVAAPADGAVTPIKCWAVPANSALDKSFPIPVQFNTGISVSFSTTGCFTKTASATAFISGDIQ